MPPSTVLAVLLLGVLIGRVELRPDNSQDVKKHIDNSNNNGGDHEAKIEDKNVISDAQLEKRTLGLVANLLGLGTLGGNMTGSGNFDLQAGLGFAGIKSDFQGKGEVHGDAGLGPGDAGVHFDAEGAVKGDAGLGLGYTGLNLKSQGKFNANGGLAQSHYGLMANEPGYKGRS